jgi:hypothetical protein
MGISERFTLRFREQVSSSKVIRRRNWTTKQWVVVAALACVLLLLGVGLAQTVVTASANVPFDFWAQGRKFPAGDYVFDSGFPGSISIRDKASKLSMAVAAVPYGDPVNKESAKLLFVRREGKYYLTELWGVLGKRVVTAEFEHRGEKNNEQREVRLVYP